MTLDLKPTSDPAPERTGLSYAEAVEAYKRAYRARHRKFLREGSPDEKPAVTY